MANFCGNCGNKLSISDNVCGNCGHNINKKNSNLDNKIVNISKKYNIGKIFIKFVVVIVICVVVFNIFIYFTGYKSIVRKSAKAFETYNLDSLVSMSSEVYSSLSDEEMENMVEGYIRNDVDYFEGEFGIDYKISYEILENITLSKRQMEEGLEDFYYRYDYEGEGIDKVIGIGLRLTATGKKNGETLSTETSVIVSKEGRRWRLISIGD